MNKLMKTGVISALVLAGILATSTGAFAVPINVTLSTWNQTGLSASGDSLNVAIDYSTSTLTVSWVSGNGNVLPTAIGIDKFFFNGTKMQLGTPAVPASCKTGPPTQTQAQCLANNRIWLPGSPATPDGVTSPGWTLNTNKATYNADGFTLEYFNSMDNPGGNQTSGIVFTFANAAQFAADFNANSGFAAHVRYDNSCSGFVSNQASHPGPASDANCAAPPDDTNPPQEVPEPTSLLLLGPGLLLAGMLRRRK